MADKQRHRYGASNPVVAAVDSTTVIEIGDMVYLDTDDAKNAAALSASSTLAETQEAFHDLFLGVAAQRSRNGDTDPIRVDTEGVFEFACESATFEIGGLVGPAESSGAAIEDQKVVAVATANLAVGRVAQREASAVTSVFVRIFSTIMLGGPQSLI